MSRHRTLFSLSFVTVFSAAPLCAFAQSPSVIPSASVNSAAIATPPTGPEVCYLIQYISVHMPGGIRGIAPGTPVTIIEDRGEVLKVKSEDLQFEVKKAHVTKDMRVAQQVSQTDARVQQRAADSITAQERGVQQQHQAQNAQQSQLIGADDEVRNLDAEYRALQAQESELLLKIGKAKQLYPWFNQRGKVYHREPDPTHSQLPYLQGRLHDVQQEKNEARRRLDAAQRQNQPHP